MRLLTILLIAFFTINCSESKDLSENTTNTQKESEVVEAKLIQKKSHNKAGKELPGAGDYYLILEGEEVFVKIMESKVTAEELDFFLNKTANFEIVRGEGLWDTDDPNVQSRIGPYVAILSIKN
ncbi:MAG: hypothetical protein HUJ25_09160 [Crocinitomicaceae bacterium]|nr:hypothetical protein [Crocinitomicaceae bacterium]